MAFRQSRFVQTAKRGPQYQGSLYPFGKLNYSLNLFMPLSAGRGILLTSAEDGVDRAAL
ncbi:hypothetical protein [Erwinia tracheiphila]|uniref:hypothetical protein n=1 Tax=Erwinia tracheiphila TaxID=65700 RepID=UPI0013792878|nr:hypothetical protein [Erwinia tracheiphila]